MSLESFAIERLGVRRESNEIRFYSVLAFRIAELRMDHKFPTQVEGAGPKEGPAIFVGNHRNRYDVIKVFKAQRLTSGRIIRTLTRWSLLYPEEQEPEELLEEIGEKEDDLDSGPIWKREVRAFFLRGIGTVGVKRRQRNIDTFRKVNQLLSQKMLVGTFISDTRMEDGTVKDVMEGPAFLARMNPDVDIYPVGISGYPDGPETIRIGTSLTYRSQLTNSLGEFAILLGDRVTELLPKRVQRDWQARRAQELEWLTSKEKS